MSGRGRRPARAAVRLLISASVLALAASFVVPPAAQQQQQGRPFQALSPPLWSSASSGASDGMVPSKGSSSSSAAAAAAAAASTTTGVRLPPRLGELDRGAANARKVTAALTEATAAARSSTFNPQEEQGQGQGQGKATAMAMERVGSKDVEIRLPASFTPLERIAVSAEGDLQRIVASYYNAAVTVRIRRCAEVEAGLFDREVDLAVNGQVFCTATSSLAPRTAECARLLREQGLGLGQLFRHLRVHPDFTLLEVGKAPDTGFWRLYELDCPGVLNCRILERFRPDTFHLAA